jgi:hypothetical protein
MWLGLMHYSEPVDDLKEASAIVVAYEPHRLFSEGAPVAAAPTLIRLLREASGAGEHVEAPRCGRCGHPLEVPEIECASA